MQALLGEARRGLAGLTDELVSFKGRARIVDVIYLGLVLAVIGMMLRMPLDLLPWDKAWYAGAAVDVAFCIPFAALFVRRLHDQGLSAFWALLLLPFPPVNLYESYRAVFAVRNQEWLFQPDPLASWKLLLFPVALAVLALYLRPGQRGPNRHGPDPRGFPAQAPA